VRDLVLLLLEAGGLADLVAEVVQLGAANLAAASDLDSNNLGRVHGERALDADAERDLANREGLTIACAVTADDRALENLDTLTSTLDDLVAHLDVVSDLEGRQVVTDLLLLYGANDVH